MSPIFGKKDPAKLFEETLKKAEDLYDHYRYAEALEYVKKAHEIARNIPLRQEDLSNLWDLNGRILDHLGKYDEALSCYDKAISLNPENEGSWLNKLVPLTNLEKWSEVNETCDKALELIAKAKREREMKEPKKWILFSELRRKCTWEFVEASIWNKKGLALTYLSRLNEALDCYNKALQRDSQYTLAHVNKAHIYGLEGRFEEMSKSLLEGYNVHNKKFMKPLPPGEDPDLFLEALMEVYEDWKRKEKPIEVLVHQCTLCPRTSLLKMHLILKSKRNDETYLQEFAPPLCRSYSNGIPRAQIEEKGEPIRSIRSIPRYNEVMRFMAHWTETEYETAIRNIPEVYGNYYFEVAWDKNRITMLIPSSINTYANFENFITLPLNSLDTGFSPDGIALVGSRKTIVNRKFIDAFVNCVKDIYSIPWQDIKALVHESETFPMILVADQFTFIISPFLIEGYAWIKDKYNPETKVL